MGFVDSVVQKLSVKSMEAILILYWATPLKLVFFVQHRGLEGSTPVVSQYNIGTAFVDFVVQNCAPVWSILKILDKIVLPCGAF